MKLFTQIKKAISYLFAAVLITMLVTMIMLIASLSIREQLAPQRLLDITDLVFQREGLAGLQRFCDNSYENPTKSMGYHTWCSIYDNKGTPTLHITITEEGGPNQYKLIAGRDKNLF